MPTYAEVIEHENNALPNIIRLVASGQFYRAYNRSAWLFNTCIVSYKVIKEKSSPLEGNYILDIIRQQWQNNDERLR